MVEKSKGVTLLDYVAIQDFVTDTKGGGVGHILIKDNIPYKRRYDIENTQPAWYGTFVAGVTWTEQAW